MSANLNEKDPLKDIRGVIVDLDGTLLHTALDLHVAVNRMCQELSLPLLDLDTVINFIGKGVENLIRCALGVNFSPAEVEQRLRPALASFGKHYMNVSGEFATIYPGVREGLQMMHDRGLRLACITNKPIAFTIPLLKKTGLYDYFELIYGGDSFEKRKPDPMQLLRACEHFGLNPAQVVSVGDSINDSQAARAAGCPALTVPYGYNHGQGVQGIDSDGIVSSLLQAAHLITA